jgi:hypothetical protein
MRYRVFKSAVSLLIFACLVLAAGSARAWVDVITELGRAHPNACFEGVGLPYPDGPPCPEGSREKTDQVYVWGLTQEGDSLWFGTGANVLCTTTGAFFGATDPNATGSYVCEYGESQIAQRYPNIPPQFGDWRPPEIYEYDLTTDELMDRTPRSDSNIRRSMGLRSAGSLDGVVFLGGGSLGGGIILFAFDANTKEYLGSHEFTGYRSIRKWLVVKNRLYFGTVTPTGQGRILRWFGNRDDLWNFRVVGVVAGLPRELTEYIDADGLSRIAVSAKTMWVSPAIAPGTIGLLPAQRTQWIEFWSPAAYDPDPVTMATYVGGGIQYFDGWVYWGTMHIPGNAMNQHSNCTDPETCFGPPGNSIEYYELYYGTFRTTSIWRARNLESATPEIQLLYGESELPAYNPGTHSFDVVPNVSGYVPLYGASGFGNRLNNYTWVMATVGGRLFAGTMDSTYLYYSTSPDAGADLWSFASSSEPAVAEDTTGLSNRLNYGVRCLIPSDDGRRLFAGMANNMNLEPEGGWFLYQLDSFSTSYQINATAGANGAIAPAGVTAVNYGGSQAYTITPDTGYHVADVLVDGGSVGALTSYTFDNVTGDRTIHAEFEVDVP